MSKILIVDANLDMQTLYEQKLEKNYEMIFSQDGNDALKIVSNYKDVDVIIADMSIPNLSGIEFIKRVKELDPIKKSIIVSFYGDFENIRKAINVGAYDFLIKPLDFVDLVNTIDKAIVLIKEERKNIETNTRLIKISEEIDSTAELQKSILPDNWFRSKNVEIYGRNDPANEVGGDFFDFFDINERYIGVLIADVSGKNLSAAMFMSMAKSLLKSFGRIIIEPNKCMELFNRSISTDNKSGMFVTCFYCVIDTLENKMKFVNAGHHAPMIINEKLGINKLKCESGIPVGIEEDMTFIAEEYAFQPGDRVMLYTDGVVEATNILFEEYEEPRFLKILEEKKDKDIQELSDSVFDDVKAFTGSAPQFDDITVVCIKYRYKLDY